VTTLRPILLAAVASVSALLGASSDAQTPLTTELAAAGLSSPVFLTNYPGLPERLLVVQRNGHVRTVLNGTTLNTSFINIVSKVTSGGERGLLGMAFHPDFDQNGYFYLAYTRSGDSASIVERYSVDAGHPLFGDVSSGQVVLGPISQPFSNHNGGGIAFGPDGKLYVATGDGGSAGDPACRAQNPNSLLGKMLRINDDGTIPSDNPYVGVPGVRDEIWAVGLRNPWRFSFDSLTGDMWIADVGQGSREEINLTPVSSTGGENYGWKMMEGLNCYGTSGCAAFNPPACNSPLLTDPIHNFTHGGGRCSITGGYVYRGDTIPDLRGAYFSADYCSGQIWTLRYDGASVTELIDRESELDPPGGASITNISSFGQTEDGEIYIVELGGQIWKVVPDVDLLEANVGSISASGGGSQSFSLYPSDANLAGMAYILLGSASGTSPGFPIDGQVLPLNVLDPWFNFTLASANTPPLGNTFSFLDANAQASASLTLGAGSPASLVGLHLDHAYAVLDLGGTGQVVLTSNAVGVDIVP